MNRAENRAKKKAKPVDPLLEERTKSLKISKKAKMKILIASGVNLDLLGTREVGIYGKKTLKDMQVLLKSEVSKLESQFKVNIRLVFFQTNDEHKFLKELSKGYSGAVINAGSWSHTSLAIADRLIGLQLPYAVAHVSDVSKREVFRKSGFIDAHAIKIFSGHGIRSYWLALESLLSFLIGVEINEMI